MFNAIIVSWLRNYFLCLNMNENLLGRSDPHLTVKKYSSPYTETKFQCRIYKRLPLVPITSKVPSITSHSYIVKMYYKIILSPTPSTSK
jgi:hypothetical protein